MDRDQDMLPMWSYLDQNVKEAEAEDCKDEITGCVRFIASLSCVDGLVLAAPNLTIRGFGAEILQERGGSRLSSDEREGSRKYAA